MENVGRYLCKAYFSGRLGCSQSYEEGSANFLLARCVEKPLEDAKGNRGKTAETWRKLMSGDLAKLNHMARARVMGGRAQNREWGSIDGGSLHELELMLYAVVGAEFKKLVAKRGVKGKR